MFKGLDFKWSQGTFESRFTRKVIFKNGREENHVPNITVRDATKPRIAREKRKNGHQNAKKSLYRAHLFKSKRNADCQSPAK